MQGADSLIDTFLALINAEIYPSSGPPEERLKDIDAPYTGHRRVSGHTYKCQLPYLRRKNDDLQRLSARLPRMLSSKIMIKQ